MIIRFIYLIINNLDVLESCENILLLCVFELGGNKIVKKSRAGFVIFLLLSKIIQRTKRLGILTLSKMKILTHPKELTRDNLEKWRKEFVKKMKRTTTRTDLDRLILAVDRRKFKEDYMAGWTKVIFENGKGKVTTKEGLSEKFVISEFERKILGQKKNHLGSLFRKILDQKKNLKNTELKKSALTQENGEWTLDSSLKEISRGGEAVVLEETIEGLKVAVRVRVPNTLLYFWQK